MPYIAGDDRRDKILAFADTEINKTEKAVVVNEVKNAGDLNFAITSLILEYLTNQERVGYAQYNEVIGVLECAKLEMYRRAVAPYEDTKIKENGDVY